MRGGGHSVPGFGTCRRRRRHRSVRHARGARSIRAPRRAGRRRRHVGRLQRRDLPVRAGHDRRHHLHDRRRRADARRRDRLPRPRLRPVAATTCLAPTWSPRTAGQLHATDRENDDLFWALRGGGGNFGVVTSFEFRLHPVKDIYGGPMFFELSDAENDPAVLPRLHRRRAGADGRVPGLPDRAAAAVHPRGPTRRHVHRVGRLLGRPAGRGRGGAQAVPRRGAGRRRVRRPDARTRRSTARSTRSSRPGLQHYWKANFVEGAHRRGHRGAPARTAPRCPS